MKARSGSDMVLQRRESFDVFCPREEIEQRYRDSIKLLFHHVTCDIVESSAGCLQANNETGPATAFSILMRLDMTQERWDVTLEVISVKE